MFCPFRNDECTAGCAIWSSDFEECALLLLGESMKEVSFAADSANFDCGVRVHVTKEEVYHGD